MLEKIAKPFLFAIPVAVVPIFTLATGGVGWFYYCCKIVITCFITGVKVAVCCEFL